MSNMEMYMQRISRDVKAKTCGYLEEAIVTPNSSGQGYDEDHVENPYHHLLTQHGFIYSHSTPVTHLMTVYDKDWDKKTGKKFIYHTYKKGERNISVHIDPDSTWQYKSPKNKFKWSGSKSSASGRHKEGNDVESLQKYLKNIRNVKEDYEEGLESFLNS
jgi:hypothetical protein